MYHSVSGNTTPTILGHGFENESVFENGIPQAPKDHLHAEEFFIHQINMYLTDCQLRFVIFVL